MRRVPFVVVQNKKLYYKCPKCLNVLPRDLYILQDWCPSCDAPINRTSRGMMKFYKIADKEFYKIFISDSRG